MSRPAHAFATLGHTVYPTGTPGVYRAEPGGDALHLSLERQEVPAALLDGVWNGALEGAMVRAVGAWLMARGGRELNLNGVRRAVRPQDLECLPLAVPRRVVSIAPSNAEIVGALGAAELLVGVESSSDFPPAVRSLPRLGPDLDVNMQALAALQPDLVLASLTVPGMERNVAALNALGLPMLVMAPRTLDEIKQDIARIGGVLGKTDGALRVLREMESAEQRIEASLRRAAAARGAGAGGAPVRVLLQWWHNPIFTPAMACWSNDLIRHAGGVNVFEHLSGQSAEVGPEAVVAADPELIFLSWCGVPQGKLNPQRVLGRRDLAAVSAVREGRVYPLDEALLGRPGPRVVEGMARMAERIAEAREGREAR